MKLRLFLEVRDWLISDVEHFWLPVFSEFPWRGIFLLCPCLDTQRLRPYYLRRIHPDSAAVWPFLVCTELEIVIHGFIWITVIHCSLVLKSHCC